MNKMFAVLAVLVALFTTSVVQANTLANIEGNFDVWQSELTIIVRADNSERPTFDVLNRNVDLEEVKLASGPVLGSLVNFHDRSVQRIDVTLKNRKSYLYLPEGPIVDILGRGQVLMVFQRSFDSGRKNEIDARLRIAYPKTTMPPDFEHDGKLIIERRDAVIGMALFMEWTNANVPGSWWQHSPGARTASRGGASGYWSTDNPFASNFESLWVAGSLNRSGQPVVANNNFPPSVTKAVVWKADGEYKFYHLDLRDNVVVEHRHYSPKPATAVEATSWGQVKAQMK